jgi:PAS domain S-box-containing protein
MNAEDILRCAIDVCPVGIIVVDASGMIVLANNETARMFGYAPDELIGQTVEILVPDHQRAAHARQRDQFVAHPRRRVVKTRNLVARRKDGTEFPVEIGLNPAVTRDKLLIVGVVSDLTDRNRLENLKDEFVATVSHELRTPLTSISGALGLLIGNTGETLPATVMRLLRIAHANSRRLVRLVDSILTIEKIESGKVVFAVQMVEIRSLLRRTVEANQGFADTHGVRIRLDAAATLGEIRADPDWLVQIVTNLLSNAIKFSPPGEEVVLSAQRHDEVIRISVRDHGRGIPVDFKSRIFEKFAQANTSDARQQGGTGLGLSIVKQIVTRLGGRVDFEDAPGGGALFYVDLPISPHAAASDTDGESDAVRAHDKVTAR